VEQQKEHVGGVKRFGSYLRGVREGRKLSLDAVEELSTMYPERITKSHLSRIENGQALPTFPRMFALGQIYGVPVASLAERFEVHYQLEQLPKGDGLVLDRSGLQARLDRLRDDGRYAEALDLILAAIEAAGDDTALRTDLRVGEVQCLVHLGRFELAKAQCEELLGLPLVPRDRVLVLHHFVTCCFRLGRFALAGMVLEQTRQEAVEAGLDVRVLASLENLGGNLMVATGIMDRARMSYERAVSLFEQIPNDFEACRSRINLAYARYRCGDLPGCLKDLDGALETAQRGGFERLQAMAWSHLAAIHFERREHDQSESFAIRSNAIARKQEFFSLVFRNCFYLWRIARTNGDTASEKMNERTLRAYLSKVDETMPETSAFREALGSSTASAMGGEA
jgi:transcriptional regulator with XRE-family HTH domain